MALTRTRLLGYASAAVTLLSGCADVPSTGPTPPDLRSEFRFVNAAPDLGSVQVSVDGVAEGTLDFTGSTAYKNYPAGSRAITLSNGEAQFVAMTTDFRGTIAFLPSASAAAREFFRVTERRLFDTPRTALRVLNLNPAYEVDVRVFAGADTAVAVHLAYKGNGGYRALAAGTYQVEVKTQIANRDTVLSTTSVNLTTSQTTMILGNVATVSLLNLTDN